MTERPSPDLLRKLLRYEPETGSLYWLERPLEMFKSERARNSWNTRYAGNPALTADSGHGYLIGCVLNQMQKAHRVIWAMQTGAWPTDEVDHINRNRSDNRWANLRQATRSENMRNVSSDPKSKSQYLGVSWYAAKQKWQAQISAGAWRKTIGRFDDEVSAARAYDAAARLYHGEFANLNFSEGE